MLKMDEFFGGKKSIPENKLKTNMSILLLPWIALWIFLPINKVWAGILGIIVCSIIPLLTYKFVLTIYDKISIMVVCIISILALLDANSTLINCLPYLLFGLTWLFSCAFKIPLTAYYSSNDYNGEKAFENPLFIRTNRILTMAWGWLYVIIAAYSYFLMGSVLAKYMGLINLIAPSLMGLFTVWFSRWYPARIARR